MTNNNYLSVCVHSWLLSLSLQHSLYIYTYPCSSLISLSLHLLSGHCEVTRKNEAALSHWWKSLSLSLSSLHHSLCVLIYHAHAPMLLPISSSYISKFWYSLYFLVALPFYLTFLCYSDLLQISMYCVTLVGITKITWKEEETLQIYMCEESRLAFIRTVRFLRPSSEEKYQHWLFVQMSQNYLCWCLSDKGHLWQCELWL